MQKQVHTGCATTKSPHNAIQIQVPNSNSSVYSSRQRSRSSLDSASKGSTKKKEAQASADLANVAIECGPVESVHLTRRHSILSDSSLIQQVSVLSNSRRGLGLNADWIVLLSPLAGRLRLVPFHLSLPLYFLDSCSFSCCFSSIISSGFSRAHSFRKSFPWYPAGTTTSLSPRVTVFTNMSFVGSIAFVTKGVSYRVDST